MTGIWIPCWNWQRLRWRDAAEKTGVTLEEWAARVLDAEISRNLKEREA